MNFKDQIQNEDKAKVILILEHIFLYGLINAPRGASSASYSLSDGWEGLEFPDDRFGKVKHFWEYVSIHFCD